MPGRIGGNQPSSQWPKPVEGTDTQQPGTSKASGGAGSTGSQPLAQLVSDGFDALASTTAQLRDKLLSQDTTGVRQPPQNPPSGTSNTSQTPQSPLTLEAGAEAGLTVGPDGVSANLDVQAQAQLQGGPFSLTVGGYAQVGTSQTTQGETTTFRIEAEVGVRGEAGLETGIVSGTVSGSAGGRASYEVTLPATAAAGITSPEQAAALLSPFHPEQLPVGASITLHGESFVQTGMSVTFENIGRVFDVTASDSVERARGMSIAVNKVDENTVRVTIGPTEAVSRAGGLSVSAFGVSVGMTDTVSVGQQHARQVDFNVSTPEGLAAYNRFLATGELPGNDAAQGTSNAATVQLYTGEMTRELSLGVSLGQGTLASDNVLFTTYDDGRQQFEWTTSIGPATYTMGGTPDDPSTFTYQAQLPGVNSGTVNALVDYYGPNVTGNVQGTTLGFTFSSADAQTLHERARQWVSDFEAGALGVSAPPFFVTEMAQAESPQQALSVLLNPTMSYDMTLIADRMSLLSIFNPLAPEMGPVGQLHVE